MSSFVLYSIGWNKSTILTAKTMLTVAVLLISLIALKFNSINEDKGTFCE